MAQLPTWVRSRLRIPLGIVRRPQTMLIGIYLLLLLQIFVTSRFQPFPSSASRLALLEARVGQTIRWAHGVNTQAALENAFASHASSSNATQSTLMLEADVMPATEQRPDIFMCHPPCLSGGGLAFKEWLDRVLKLCTMSNFSTGIKLDFKHPEAAESALKLVAARAGPDGTLGIPVWLNADILQGPGGGAPKFSGQKFLQLCHKHYPKGRLSLGWATGIPWLFVWLQGYTATMVDEMLELVKGAHTADITFAVRGEFCPNSWPQLRRLLDGNANHTLTVWGGGGMDEWLLLWIERNMGALRASLDLDSTPLFWPQVFSWALWSGLLAPLLLMLTKWCRPPRRARAAAAPRN